MALAGILAAARLKAQSQGANGGGKKKPLREEVFLFLGAGEAAIGIADLIAYAIKREAADAGNPGMSIEEARKNIWLFDSKGLIVAGRDHVTEHKAKYAHPGGALRRVSCLRGDGFLFFFFVVDWWWMMGWVGSGRAGLSRADQRVRFCLGRMFMHMHLTCSPSSYFPLFFYPQRRSRPSSRRSRRSSPPASSASPPSPRPSTRR